jgi:aspartate/methionine/tyrosine aminotransferase
MTTIEPFALERYFARHEFKARHLLSCSDCEALRMDALLAMADEETRRLWDNLKLGYTESQGHPRLRSAIAEHYRGLEAEDILVVVPEEGIFLLMQALLAPGDHVVCTFPGYQSLYAVARSIGCSVSFWTGDESQGWRFDLDQLEKMLQNSTRLVVANFPHNPTGYLPPREDFEAMINLLRERNIYLLSDEMYRFLEQDATDTLPAACELYEKAITLFGLSKTFGLPGLRLGWTATRDRGLLAEMGRLKDYTTICSSAPSEILGLMALQNQAPIVARQKTRLQKNLTVLDRFWDNFGNYFQGWSPRAGSLCFPRMTVVADTHTFCEELVQETGIMLVPSRMFAFGDHHVRIGFGREDFPQVLARFGDYLRMRFG